MAVTSTYAIGITFEGSVTYEQTFSSAANSASPGQIQIIDLASGNNTITVPDDSTSVTIIPPSNNTDTLTLKGVNGDTGIALHPSNPCTISFASSVTTFVVSAGAAIAGVRFIYT